MHGSQQPPRAFLSTPSGGCTGVPPGGAPPESSFPAYPRGHIPIEFCQVVYFSILNLSEFPCGFCLLVRLPQRMATRSGTEHRYGSVTLGPSRRCWAHRQQVEESSPFVLPGDTGSWWGAEEKGSLNFRRELSTSYVLLVTTEACPLSTCPQLNYFPLS